MRKLEHSDSVKLNRLLSHIFNLDFSDTSSDTDIKLERYLP